MPFTSVSKRHLKSPRAHHRTELNPDVVKADEQEDFPSTLRHSLVYAEVLKCFVEHYEILHMWCINN